MTVPDDLEYAYGVACAEIKHLQDRIRALAAERDEALREQVLRLNDATQHHNARVNEKEARQKAAAENERLKGLVEEAVHIFRTIDFYEEPRTDIDNWLARAEEKP